MKSNVVEDAKPGDVEAVVKEQLDAAKSKVVVEELVSKQCDFSSAKHKNNFFSPCLLRT